MARIIGIDLGTTNSLCAVFGPGGPRLLPTAGGGLLTPSVVALLDSGEVLVGQAAREHRVVQPRACASFFKRLIGTPRQLSLGDLSLDPIELSSVVLRSLKADAEAALGEAITEAVITVPAYFNDHQRLATRQAGRLAGLNVRRIVNEPTAAALTYGFHDRHSERSLLVFDLGGGTFDVTLMDVFEGNLEIVATAGESQLGGEDFTDALAAWALEQFDLQAEATALGEPERWARLRLECERYKCAGAAAQAIRLPAADGTIGPDAPSLAPDGEVIDAIFAPLVERLVGPLTRVLRDAGRQPREIDETILVGGATRLAQVRAMVAAFTGGELLQRFDPDHVVALGAAVQAALIADDAAVEDLVATDVCPHTLGVETAKEIATQFRRGYFLPIIHRNTTIPVSCEKYVSTVHAGQTCVKLEIYQGESRRVEDNLRIGELEVRGIPSGPPGQVVGIRFTYDLNGLLEVEARIEETGQVFQTVIEHAVEGLSEADVARAVERMQAIKFYPRDELANRELLAFASRVVGEVEPLQREGFEGVVDDYEQALAGSERSTFVAMREQLLIALSALGFPYVPPRAPDGGQD
ncbi:Hsp70 family protein [Engelhardtia mirabilis]|uniref:Chaperone protein HscC n=1 Tax=Engelhardtia mirabilis TaxID=2528011 RepID=A0A518BI05_9BACT|nr:Chaperone protein HscC [Planctomycetes bacterium Pla133]QDV00921.1 Chaperone protein HscC [Planctomycetes bacterium Pla86]